MRSVILALALLLSCPALAAQHMDQAQEPAPALACYQVVDVSSDDVLNMRQGPHYTTDKVGEIPPFAACVADLNEFSYVGRYMWKKVAYGGATGWVNARYLAPVENCTAQDMPRDAAMAHTVDAGQAAMREGGVESVDWITGSHYLVHMTGLHHELHGELMRGSDEFSVCGQRIFQALMRATDDQHKNEALQIYFRVWDFRVIGVDGVCVLPGFENAAGQVYD